MTDTTTKHAYAAHWDGTDCPDCKTTCHWNADDATLECACSTRSALSVWLGNTPTERETEP